MVESWKELFGNSMNTYIWLAVLTSWVMISKLELNKKNLNIKISIIYILFFLLALFDIFDIKNLILILIIVFFGFIEFILVDDFQRSIFKKIYYCSLDFFYKIIFEYKFLYFLLSMFLISNFFRNISKSIILFFGINNIINIANFEFLYPIVTISLSILCLCRGILKSINNEFEVYSFSEIIEKMNAIMPFSKFRCNTKLYDFSKILIDREDHSFFERVESYNWISVEFIVYRLRRMYKESEKCTSSNSLLLRKINFILYILKKIIKCIVNEIHRLIFITNKVVLHRKNIKSYIRGYSTIEMQLIRTLAVKHGYSSHVFQRKAYEFIYSKIFFSSLKKYYRYHYYPNIDEYKYYLIYLYIRVAPVRLNGVSYKNILELYQKERLNNITIEEFYVWVYGLSHYSINKSIMDNKKIEIYKMNKKKLAKLIEKFEEV